NPLYMDSSGDERDLLLRLVSEGRIALRIEDDRPRRDLDQVLTNLVIRSARSLAGGRRNPEERAVEFSNLNHERCVQVMIDAAGILPILDRLKQAPDRFPSGRV